MMKILTTHKDKFPGVMVSVAIALSAAFLSEHYGPPIMLMALLLGMIFNFSSDTPKLISGIDFCANSLLKVGIGLLGARITLNEVTDLGVLPILSIACLSVTIIAIGMLAGRYLKLTGYLGTLAGGAVAICGASATIAIAAVLPNKKEKDQAISFTIIGVTSLSTLAMIFYPMIATWFELSPEQTGLFLGASIHDVAQVVGAGYGVSEDVGDTASIVKLFRVALLMPSVLIIALITSQAKAKNAEKSPLPLFMIVFIVLMIANTAQLIPELIVDYLSDLSRWLLVISIAAIGMRTHLARLKAIGITPMLLIIIETLLMMIGALLISIVLL